MSSKQETELAYMHKKWRVKYYDNGERRTEHVEGVNSDSHTDDTGKSVFVVYDKDGDVKRLITTVRSVKKLDAYIPEL